jgi:hypothetical protein
MSFARYLFKILKRTGSGGVTIAVAGTTGQALSYTLPGISAVLASSTSNIGIDGMTISLTDVTAAGAWSCSVNVTNASGNTVLYQLTFTLTGGAWVGDLSGVGAATMGITTATFTYTLTGSATYAQVAVNELTSIYTLDNTLKKVTILQPNSRYEFYLRGTDGTNFGPWTAAIVGTTLDDAPPPVVIGTTAIRAVAFSEGLHTNCQLNWATLGFHPQTAFARSNATKGSTYLTTTWDTTGWVLGHFEPLAKVGLRYIRSLGGASSANSHQAVQVPKKIYNDCYGSRMHYTMSQYTAAQMSTALAADSTAAVGSISLETAVERIRSAQPECVRTIQGMNEPNNTADPHFTASSTWPGGWKTITMDHAYVLGTLIASIRSQFPSDFQLLMWSPWSRLLLRIRQMLYAGYSSIGVSPYTLTGTWAPFTSVTLGKQHVRDILPLYDATNLHYYNGGRRPPIAGDTNDSSSTGEQGADAEITLDEVISHYRELCQGDANFPIWMTENGWEVGGGSPDGAIGGRTVYAARYLTEKARMKYFQRQWFENLKRGIVSTNIFELFDNPSDVPTNNTVGNGRVFGMIKWSFAGNTVTFTRRKLWYMTWCTLAPLFDGNTSTGAEAATARTFTPADLVFTLDNQAGAAVDGNIKSLLFQKSNGKWILALWLDTESWQRSSTGGVFSAAVNETFQSKPVRVTLGSSASMRSTRPFVDADSSTATNTWSGTTVGTQFNITVHDDVSFVEIT